MNTHKTNLTLAQISDIGKVDAVFLLRDRVESFGLELTKENYILYLSYYKLHEVMDMNYDEAYYMLACQYLSAMDVWFQFKNIDFDGSVLTVREVRGEKFDAYISDDLRKMREIEGMHSNSAAMLIKYL